MTRAPIGAIVDVVDGREAQNKRAIQWCIAVFLCVHAGDSETLLLATQ